MLVDKRGTTINDMRELIGAEQVSMTLDLTQTEIERIRHNISNKGHGRPPKRRIVSKST